MGVQEQAMELMRRAMELMAGATPAQAEGPPWTPYPTPQMRTIKGATFWLKAPVCEDWEPTLHAKIFGQIGAIVRDPSNADVGAGQKLRSPKGYPLHYTYQGKPLVIYGEFKTDDDGPALDELKKRLKERDDNLKSFGKQF